MRLYTDPGNFQSLKVHIAAKISSLKIEKQIRSGAGGGNNEGNAESVIV